MFFVAIMDDEPASLQLQYSLLRRHIAIHIDEGARFTGPSALLSWLSNQFRTVDVIVVDAEYKDGDWPLPQLIQQLKQLSPQTEVICLSQYGEHDTIRQAIRAGADGILVKADVAYALPSAIALSPTVPFLYTPSVRQYVQMHLPHATQTFGLPYWQMYEGLPPAKQRFAEATFLRGLSNSAVADEQQLNRDSVNTMRNSVKHAVNDARDEVWHDTTLLSQPQLKKLGLDSLAFHILSSFPAAHIASY